MNSSVTTTSGTSVLEAEMTQDNVTQTINDDPSVSAIIEMYSIPTICLIGLIGNSLSFYVFVQESYRKSSCGVFLAFRCLSDNGFLFTLLLVWSSMTFDLRLSKVSIMCQSIICLTYVCGCMSVWLVVFVTMENYIRIAKPHLIGKLCRTDTARFIVLVLFVVVICCYSFPFWTMGANCDYKTSNDINHIVRFMVYLDTFITLVIPTGLVSVLMVVIVTQMLNSRGRRQRLSTSSSIRLKRARHPITKVTRMLLAVTLTYFILNLPSHVVRINLMLKTMMSEDSNVKPQDATLQTISLQIYYLSLAVNVLVYYFFGSKFRSVLLRSFLKSNERNFWIGQESSSAFMHTSNKTSDECGTET